MAIMKRDVNLGLLLLIVAALIMFSGFTVYYQTTFKNISKSYETKLKEIEGVSKELESKRGLLNETSIQLQLKNQKEDALSKQFVDTKSEKDQLETDKKKLEVELSSAKADLASTLQKLTTTQNQLASQIELVQQLSAQVLSLKNDVDRYKADYQNYKTKYECAKSKPDAEEGSC